MRIKQQSLLPFSLEQLVMNGKPLDRKAFENGQQLARAKRAMNRSSQAPQTKSTKHHTESDSTTLRTTGGGGRGKVGHSNRTFKKKLNLCFILID